MARRRRRFVRRCGLLTSGCGSAHVIVPLLFLLCAAMSPFKLSVNRVVKYVELCFTTLSVFSVRTRSPALTSRTCGCCAVLVLVLRCLCFVFVGLC